jgi:membrane fusion protein, multidrug efflux system
MSHRLLPSVDPLLSLRRPALALTIATALALPAVAQTATPVSVPVMAVGSQTVAASLTLDATVQAVRQTTLAAQASGRVAQLLVKAGDRVKAGQLLAVIDDRVTQAGVAQAGAGVAQAQAQRARDLRSKGFVAQAVLDGAEAQLRAAQAGLKAAQAGQTQSAVAQGFTRLTAPYDGWVQQTHVELGSLAMPGSPVVSVYAPQPLRAVAFVPASQHAAAQQAASVQVLLPAGAQGAARWVQPVAKSVVPVADAVSQTVEWRLDMAAADTSDLVPGRQVQVRFAGLPAASAGGQRLLVPSAAVLRRGELTAVYVASAEGPFQLRAVRLGERGSLGGQPAVAVVAGLKAGERVALDPVRAGLAGAVAQ